MFTEKYLHNRIMRMLEDNKNIRGCYLWSTGKQENLMVSYRQIWNVYDLSWLDMKFFILEFSLLLYLLEIFNKMF